MVLNFFRSKVAYCDIDREIRSIETELDNIRLQEKIIDRGLILFAVSTLLYVINKSNNNLVDNEIKS